MKTKQYWYPLEPKRLWVMRSPIGIAPYFGCARTRRELLDSPQWQSCTTRERYKPVRLVCIKPPQGALNETLHFDRTLRRARRRRQERAVEGQR